MTKLYKNKINQNRDSNDHKDNSKQKLIKETKDDISTNTEDNLEKIYKIIDIMYNKRINESLYIRIQKHAIKELNLLRWYGWEFLFCIIVNISHGIAHNIAYLLHIPRKPLFDLGFTIFPVLNSQLQTISEYVFFIIIIITCIILILPFFHDNIKYIYSLKESIIYSKKFENDCILPHPTNTKLFLWNQYNIMKPPVYTVHIFFRFFTSLACAQVLRIISFLVTGMYIIYLLNSILFNSVKYFILLYHIGLPSPNYHCHPYSPFYLPPTTIYECLFRLNLFYSCGDLIFSSHLGFVTVSGLVLINYCRNKALNTFVCIYIIIFSILVICAHKHYTIDMIIGLYTIPLVWYLNTKFFPDKYTKDIILYDIPIPVVSNGYAKYFIQNDLLNNI